jgi:4,5-dihydroxyphthalate decarboxylase
LTLACGDYEIVRALADGRVTPDGIDLNVLTEMDSTTRHWRFLRNQEFDVAEISCSSYLIARDHGLLVDAIPVFLHRRFRHGFIFINTNKGIRTPSDLIGRTIGVKQFQATAIVWMRGILQHEYGLALDSIVWVCEAYIPQVEGAISEQFFGGALVGGQESWGASFSTSRSVSCSQAFMSFLALR